MAPDPLTIGPAGQRPWWMQREGQPPKPKRHTEENKESLSGEAASPESKEDTDSAKKEEKQVGKIIDLEI
jgi:hypothetical protein